MEGFRISAEDPRSQEAETLVAELWAELVERYGDEGNGPFRVEDVTGPRSCFLIAWWKGEAIACGALRELAPGVGEVKRMYVQPRARGKGLGKKLLAELEARARVLGYENIRLETGMPQPEAIGLYEGAGYRRISGYGDYKDDPRTVSYEKDLKGDR